MSKEAQGLVNYASIRPLALSIKEKLVEGKKFKYIEILDFAGRNPLVDLGTPHLRTRWNVTNLLVTFQEINVKVSPWVENLEFALAFELFIASQMIFKELSPTFRLPEPPLGEGHPQVCKIHTLSANVNPPQAPIVPPGQQVLLGIKFEPLEGTKAAESLSILGGTFEGGNITMGYDRQ